MIDPGLSKSVDGLNSPAERVNTRILLVGISALFAILVTISGGAIKYLITQINTLQVENQKLKDENAAEVNKNVNWMQTLLDNQRQIKDSVQNINQNLKNK